MAETPIIDGHSVIEVQALRNRLQENGFYALTVVQLMNIGTQLFSGIQPDRLAALAAIVSRPNSIQIVEVPAGELTITTFYDFLARASGMSQGTLAELWAKDVQPDAQPAEATPAAPVSM